MAGYSNVDLKALLATVGFLPPSDFPREVLPGPFQQRGILTDNSTTEIDLADCSTNVFDAQVAVRWGDNDNNRMKLAVGAIACRLEPVGPDEPIATMQEWKSAIQIEHRPEGVSERRIHGLFPYIGGSAKEAFQTAAADAVLLPLVAPRVIATGGFIVDYETDDWTLQAFRAVDGVAAGGIGVAVEYHNALIFPNHWSTKLLIDRCYEKLGGKAQVQKIIETRLGASLAGNAGVFPEMR